MIRKSRAGFTIIELLIVVIVIGILAAAGLAKYQNFAETSRRKTCLGNLKQIETAFAVWETNNAAFAENAKTAFAFTPRTGKLASPGGFSTASSTPGAFNLTGGEVMNAGVAPGAITDANQSTVGGPTSFSNPGTTGNPIAGPLGTIIRDDNIWMCPSALSRFYGGETANVPDDYFDNLGSGVPTHTAGHFAVGEHGRYVMVVAGKGNTATGAASLNNKGFPNDLICDFETGGATSYPSPCPQTPFKIAICGCYGKFGGFGFGASPQTLGTAVVALGGPVGPDGSTLNRHSARW